MFLSSIAILILYFSKIFLLNNRTDSLSFSVIYLHVVSLPFNLNKKYKRISISIATRTFGVIIHNNNFYFLFLLVHCLSLLNYLIYLNIMN